MTDSAFFFFYRSKETLTMRILWYNGPASAIDYSENTQKKMSKGIWSEPGVQYKEKKRFA